jgi:hypothetical protein
LIQAKRSGRHARRLDVTADRVVEIGDVIDCDEIVVATATAAAGTILQLAVGAPVAP